MEGCHPRSRLRPAVQHPLGPACGEHRWAGRGRGGSCRPHTIRSRDSDGLAAGVRRRRWCARLRRSSYGPASGSDSVMAAGTLGFVKREAEGAPTPPTLHTLPPGLPGSGAAATSCWRSSGPRSRGRLGRRLRGRRRRRRRVGGGVRRRCRSSAVRPPATKPQNAAPMLRIVIPDAVTTKVTTAASRPSGSVTAPASDEPSARQQREAGDRDDQHGWGQQHQRHRQAGAEAERQLPGAEGHRRDPPAAGSGWVSGPAVSAAVIAARLTAWPPNGAAAALARPVATRTGRRGGV